VLLHGFAKGARDVRCIRRIEYARDALCRHKVMQLLREVVKIFALPKLSLLVGLLCHLLVSSRQILNCLLAICLDLAQI
jgi:hypothetical protein